MLLLDLQFFHLYYHNYCNMYINSISSYLPEFIMDNKYFEETAGVDSEWILNRTGIHERRKCGPEENTNTMAWESTKKLIEQLPDDHQFDMIIGATYTPYDTVVTLAHYVQNQLGVPNIPVVSISTACSSVLNAFEIAMGYFAMDRAEKVLIVASEQNSAYYVEKDKLGGLLWGDGSVAFAVSKTKLYEKDLEVSYLKTGGIAHLPQAVSAVNLNPAIRELKMSAGKDIFMQACIYMCSASLEALRFCGLTISDVDYFIPHQANLRISHHVQQELKLPKEKLVSNIEYYGNTGCCGFGIGLAEKYPDLKKGENILAAVFGGGYSYGAMMIKA